MDSDLIAPRPAWHQHAACRGLGPSWWFPSDKQPAEVAVSICRHCPVRADCLAWAIEHPMWTRSGVWGGLTERARRAERRRILKKVA